MGRIVEWVGQRKTAAAVAGTAGIFAIVATAALLPDPSTSGVLAQTGDALNSFIGRSPGERDGAAILKGKAVRRAMSNASALGRAVTPQQRALGKIFETPPEEEVAGLSADPIGPIALSDSALPATSMDQLASGFGGGPATGGFPGGGIAFSPSPGGLTGGTPGGGEPGTGGPGGEEPGVGGPDNPIVNPPVIVGAVPEPTTWAMFLIGFAAVGMAIRRRPPRYRNVRAI